MLTFLDLSGSAKRAKEIRDFAERSENIYEPGVTQGVPGDRPEFVLLSGNTKAVFTISKFPGEEALRRHLSVSVSGRYPLPLVVWTLAHMFGFTGGTPDEHDLVHEPSKDWAFEPNPEEKCIVVQELYLPDGVN